jgi:hypothetical protein
MGVVATLAACYVWLPPAHAAPGSVAAVPMAGGPSCGKRAKVYDRIWSVKAHDGRVVFLRCGEFPDPSIPTEGWGWRHITSRGHVAQLGWDADYFMWAMQQTVKGADPIDQPARGTVLYSGPILTIRYDKVAGSWFRDEYDFKVAVVRKTGDVVTAFGNYLKTINCHTVEQCQKYP